MNFTVSETEKCAYTCTLSITVQIRNLTNLTNRLTLLKDTGIYRTCMDNVYADTGNRKIN